MIAEIDRERGQATARMVEEAGFEALFVETDVTKRLTVGASALEAKRARADLQQPRQRRAAVVAPERGVAGARHVRKLVAFVPFRIRLHAE